MTVHPATIPFLWSLLGVLAASAVTRPLLRKILTGELSIQQRRIDALRNAASRTLGDALLREAQEHMVRFSKLHDRRSEAISTLYSLLNSSEESEAAYSAMDEITTSGEQNERKELTFFILDYRDAARYFHSNRLFLSAGTCRCLEKLFEGVSEQSTAKRGPCGNCPETGRPLAATDRRAAHDCFKQHLRPAKLALENELRALLEGQSYCKEAA